MGGLRASASVLLPKQEPSKTTTLNHRRFFLCCLLGIGLDATRTLLGLRGIGLEWSNQFVEVLYLSIDLLLPTVSSASWIDLISHPRSNVPEATGLPGGTPIGVTLQVWVGLIQVHHLIAFADAATADNLFDEPLHDLKQGLVMRSSSKQLAVMEDMVVEGNKTLIDVFLNAVDAGHVEVDSVLTRPVRFLKQVIAMHVSKRLALEEVGESVLLDNGYHVKTTKYSKRVDRK